MNQDNRMNAPQRLQQRYARPRWVQTPRGGSPFAHSPPLGPSTWRREHHVQPEYSTTSPQSQAISSEMEQSMIRNKKRLALQYEAMEQLGKSIGYTAVKPNLGELKLILADAITSIEKLNPKGGLTRRPRQMSVDKISCQLSHMVPSSYRLAAKATRLSSQVDESWSELAELMLAAREYINELRETCARKFREEQEARMIRAKEREARDVAETLRKMENWCDDWLDGNLKEEDWDGFRNCLNYA